MSNRTDFGHLVAELVRDGHVEAHAADRIGTELHNAYVAGQEGHGCRCWTCAPPMAPRSALVALIALAGQNVQAPRILPRLLCEIHPQGRRQAPDHLGIRAHGPSRTVIVIYCEEWPTLNRKPDRVRPRVRLCRPSETPDVPSFSVCPKCGGRKFKSSNAAAMSGGLKCNHPFHKCTATIPGTVHICGDDGWTCDSCSRWDWKHRTDCAWLVARKLRDTT